MKGKKITMKIETKDLQEGYVLAEDVYALVNEPLMVAGTVLTEDLIKILNVFLISKVEVIDLEEKERLAKVEKEIKNQVKKEENLLFLQWTDTYKEMLQKYQLGGKIDIFAVRRFFVPIINYVLEDKNIFFQYYESFKEEEYLTQHQLAVGMLAARLGKELGYASGDCIQLGIAGLFSDIGMTKISSKIYNKKMSLTNDEKREIKKHPVYSYEMIKNMPSLTEEAMLGVLQHHEREDESGYPLKLKKEKATHFSKIIAVSDVFVALIADRPYRKKKTMFEALEIMNVQERGKYNKKVLDQLTNLIIVYVRTI